MSSSSSSSSSSFPSLGISLSHLKELSEELGLIKGDDEGTASDLCTLLIKPRTESMRSSYVEYAEAQGMKGVGPATKFISHAWSYKVKELVNALERGQWCKNNNNNQDEGTTTYLWFDVVSVNQHLSSTHSYEYSWWSTTFKSAIGAFGHTLFVFLPWDDPRPLKRCWCLWEMLCTIQSKVKFEICISESEQARFEKGMITQGPESLMHAMSSIDAATADAFDPRDKEFISLAIEKTVGFTGINTTLKSSLREWLESALTEMVDNRLNREGSVPSVDTLNLMEHFAVVLEFHGKLDQSIKMYERCLDLNTKHYGGSDSVRAVVSKANLAVAYFKGQNLSNARNLYEEISKSQNANDSSKFSAFIGLGVTSFSLSKPEEAKVHYESAYKFASQVFGEKSPEAFIAQSNLARTVCDTAKSEEDLLHGISLLKLVANGRSEILGKNHPQTLTTRLALVSSMQRSQSRQVNIDAVEEARLVLSGFQENLGALSVDALNAEITLLSLLVKVGHSNDALLTLNTLSSSLMSAPISLMGLSNFCHVASDVAYRLNDADLAIKLSKRSVEAANAKNHGTDLYTSTDLSLSQALVRAAGIVAKIGNGHRGITQVNALGGFLDSEYDFAHSSEYDAESNESLLELALSYVKQAVVLLKRQTPREGLVRAAYLEAQILRMLFRYNELRSVLVDMVESISPTEKLQFGGLYAALTGLYYSGFIETKKAALVLQARDDLEKIVPTYSPNQSGYIEYELARAYYLLGDYSLAKNLYEKVLTKLSANECFDVHIEFGRLLVQINKREDANFHFIQAIQFGWSVFATPCISVIQEWKPPNISVNSKDLALELLKSVPSGEELSISGLKTRPLKEAFAKVVIRLARNRLISELHQETMDDSKVYLEIGKHFQGKNNFLACAAYACGVDALNALPRAEADETYYIFASNLFKMQEYEESLNVLFSALSVNPGFDKVSVMVCQLCEALGFSSKISSVVDNWLASPRPAGETQLPRKIHGELLMYKGLVIARSESMIDGENLIRKGMELVNNNEDEDKSLLEKGKSFLDKLTSKPTWTEPPHRLFSIKSEASSLGRPSFGKISFARASVGSSSEEGMLSPSSGRHTGYQQQKLSGLGVDHKVSSHHRSSIQRKKKKNGCIII